MGRSAEDYYRAAIERLRQARGTHSDIESSHSLTVYIAGLSVECMLRAFIIRRTPNLEVAHNLPRLFFVSQLGRFRTKGRLITTSQRDRFDEERLRAFEAISTLQDLWSNLLRYVPENRFKTSLGGKGKLRGLKGDAVRENARLAIDSATIITDLGVLEWTHSSKS